jgi:hypothetical protein
MSRIVVVEPVKPGYRMRDLIACLVVLIIGAAFVHALRLRELGAPIRLPVAVYLGCVSALAVAFGLGAFIDRLADRFPSLIRPRRCPAVVLLLFMAGAVAVVLADEGAREMAMSHLAWIQEARPHLDELAAAIMG